jgi:quercetin dioxygenase-like cupin family protein
VLDGDGEWAGYEFPRGLLDLEDDLVVRPGADPHREAVFDARARGERLGAVGNRYDHFVDMLGVERERREDSPRVFPGESRPFEHTRQGELRYYIDNWAGLHGQDLDVAEYRIDAAERTGRHRHIAEELLYVVAGTGHDVHDGSEHPWKAGDLICIPPMTEHQHVNTGSEPARLISVWSHHPANEFLGGIEHVEDASTWTPA